MIEKDSLLTFQLLFVHKSLYGFVIDHIPSVVHFHGYPPIAISSFVLMEYVSDLFPYLAVFVPIVPVRDVVIVCGTRKLCYLQQDRQLVFMP